jgi:hypothetical protein
MPCFDGETRLENTTYSYKDEVFVHGGRVEVCYSGTYHPVCDEGWTDNDAAVVCNSIGFSSSNHKAEGTGKAEFGLSYESPFLQTPMCEGSEYTLSACPSYHLKSVTGDYCLSGKYQAGVRCIRNDTSQRCRDYEIRLAEKIQGTTDDGRDFVGGRVEICQRGIFVAVCDIGWTKDTAQDICNLMGYTDRVGVTTYGSQFGAYGGQTLLQGVTCKKSNGYLCTGSVAVDPGCSSERIAGVMCITDEAMATENTTLTTRRSGSTQPFSSLFVALSFFCISVLL